MQRRGSKTAADRDSAAAARLAPGASVIWLRHHPVALVPMQADHRAEQVAYLHALAAHPGDPAAAQPPEWPDDISAAPATDGPVCGACRGACCQIGQAYNGFIDAALLRRRQAAHGGSLDDAAAFYAAMLPAEHVRFGCLYQGAQGCVLPRSDRAPVCNGYACEALVEARQRQQSQPDAPLLLAAADHDGSLRSAVLLRADESTVLLPPD